MKKFARFNSYLFMAILCVLLLPAGCFASSNTKPIPVHHRNIEIDGVKLFYREAGDKKRPVVLLLHGFPTSSQMYRNLIPRLAQKYFVLAPDYPGFGQSSMPDRNHFDYTFANIAGLMEKFIEAKNVNRFSLYMMDYGGPIGFRLATRHPERVSAMIVQNANAYEDGLLEFWDPLRQLWQDNSSVNRDALRPFLELGGTRFQYTQGVTDTSLLSPDAWITDQYYLDREGNKEIQLDLFYDYRTNVALYPAWQEYLRQQQPPVLVVWGKNDPIFPQPGALAFKQDVQDLELHLLDTGHFALESHGPQIARWVMKFLDQKLSNR